MIFVSNNLFFNKSCDPYIENLPKLKNYTSYQKKQKITLLISYYLKCLQNLNCFHEILKELYYFEVKKKYNNLKALEIAILNYKIWVHA